MVRGTAFLPHPFSAFPASATRALCESHYQLFNFPLVGLLFFPLTHTAIFTISYILWFPHPSPFQLSCTRQLQFTGVPCKFVVPSIANAVIQGLLFPWPGHCNEVNVALALEQFPPSVFSLLSLWSTKMPRSFWRELHLSHISPILFLCNWLLSQRCRILYLFLLNIVLCL